MKKFERWSWQRCLSLTAIATKSYRFILASLKIGWIVLVFVLSPVYAVGCFVAEIINVVIVVPWVRWRLMLQLSQAQTKTDRLNGLDQYQRLKQKYLTLETKRLKQLAETIVAKLGQAPSTQLDLNNCVVDFDSE